MKEKKLVPRILPFILILTNSSSAQNNDFACKFLNLQENLFRNIEIALHLNNEDYRLKGNLFFDAFLERFYIFFQSYLLKP